MTNNDLVNHLVGIGILNDPSIKQAFLEVDRIHFMKEDEKDFTYTDVALPIGYNQTISQPYTVAFMFELLKSEKGDRILDVGSGSGWTTAMLAKLVGSSGKVIGVERIPELVEFGKNNLNKFFLANAEIVQAKQGGLGLPEESPFDKILVSASATEVPKELLEQIRPGGVMVLPVRDSILKITKTESNEILEEKYHGFAFVPLIKNG